jgi:hypothetical protein
MLRTWRLAKYAIGIVIAAAGIAACSAGGTPSFGAAAPAQSGHESGLTALSVQRLMALSTPHYVPRPMHPDHRTLRATEPPPSVPLLYVSDQSTGDVYAYVWPSGVSRPLQTTTGFSTPYGQCVDKYGRVFIADFGTGTTSEYLHGHIGMPYHTFPYRASERERRSDARSTSPTISPSAT